MLGYVEIELEELMVTVSQYKNLEYENKLNDLHLNCLTPLIASFSYGSWTIYGTPEIYLKRNVPNPSSDFPFDDMLKDIQNEISWSTIRNSHLKHAPFLVVLKGITTENMIPMTNDTKSTSIFIINTRKCYPTYKGDLNMYSDQIIKIPLNVNEPITHSTLPKSGRLSDSDI